MTTRAMIAIDTADLMEQRNIVRARWSEEIHRERVNLPIKWWYSDLDAEMDRLNRLVGLQDCLNCDTDFPVDGEEYCARCRQR